MTDTPITHPLSLRLRELSDAVTQSREAVWDADLVLPRAAGDLDHQAAEIARLREEVTAGERNLAGAMDTVQKADQEIARLRAEVEALRRLEALAPEIIPALEATGVNVSLAADVRKAADAALTPDGTAPAPGEWIAADDVRRLVRELDIALNGEGAARQASLCDIVAQVAGYASKHGPLFPAQAVGARVGVPRAMAKTDHVADEIAKFCDARSGYRAGWNDCRDAMLAAAPQPAPIDAARTPEVQP